MLRFGIRIGRKGRAEPFPEIYREKFIGCIDSGDGWDYNSQRKSKMIDFPKEAEFHI